jgi:aryl-alcohol dehydrogenase-like predicted oxidoreductase
MTDLAALDGTPVSSLCFGAMQFGGTADAAASRAMFDACREAGVTFFDTAHVYTGGESERLLGAMVAPERERLIVATKVAYADPATRANIRRSVDQSRTRLGMDVIDLLYLHRWDGATPLEESLEALAGLQAEGIVRHLGVSNYAAWQVMKAQGVAARFGTRIDAIQPMLSLVKRQVEVELLPMAIDQEIAVAPYSPLGGGLLTGKYASGGEGRLRSDARYAARYGEGWMHEAAAGLALLGAEVGVDPATLAVRWAMGVPGVTAPIVSARSAAQLAPSLAAAGFAMGEELRARIEALSRRPPPATDRLEEA